MSEPTMVRFRARHTTWRNEGPSNGEGALLEVHEEFERWDNEVDDLEAFRPAGAMGYQSGRDYAVFGTFGTAVVDGVETRVVTHHAYHRLGGLCPFCGGTKMLNLFDRVHDCLFCERTGLARNVPEGAFAEYGRVLEHLDAADKLRAMEPLIRALEAGARYAP